MASPSMVQRSGDTLIVRSVVSGDRLYLDNSESGAVYTNPQQDAPTEADEEPAEEEALVGNDPNSDQQLPQCKIKRNYDCADCDFFTQNPRHYLTHLRDVHGEKVKIFDCPHCLYASKHFQKLLRHMKMVHGINKTSAENPNSSAGAKRARKRPAAAAAKPKVEVEATDVAPSEEAQQPVLDQSHHNKCSQCDFTASSLNLVARHERREHLKNKFFPCGECNYVTNVKARFTKHVKYHSMPMIKCDVCDFQTPYKWNLDRHMKNHGATGLYTCSACNFTADIKQSLTVHEMNHHVPSVAAGVPTTAGATTATMTTQGARPGRVVRRRDGSTRQQQRTRLNEQERSRESDASPVQDDLAEITLTMVNCKQSEGSVSANDDEEYDESTRSSSIDCAKSDMCDDAKFDWSNKDSQCEEPPAKIAKKTPRPIPNLIPLNSPVTVNLMPTKAVPKENSDNFVNKSEERGASEEPSNQSSLPTMSKFTMKRKNASIFDKLFNDKLMTASVDNGILTCKDCGHSSKSLSEHKIHEKSCENSDVKSNAPNPLLSGATIGSTRCQYCRHRCKSSSDLVVHLQTCSSANARDAESPSVRCHDTTSEKMEVPEEEEAEEDAQAPHPMENVVFVWNSMLQKPDSFDATTPNQHGSIDDAAIAKKPNETTMTKDSNNKEAASGGKKVFKCPHCSFWASTASRFHVHIVGHLNRKPFECSLCAYKSNWRWDITKHIRLKSVRDPEHAKAKVLMTDDTGRRNYSKYNRYLQSTQVCDPSADVASSPSSASTLGGSSGGRKSREMIRVTHILDDDDETLVENDANNGKGDELAEIRLQTMPRLDSGDRGDCDNRKSSKKTVWKCKKCDYRNTSKDALLVHVRKHSKHSAALLQTRHEIREQSPSNELEANPITDSSGVTFRCGHCNQVSNWKHVIQRHCRLKHNGDVKVIIGTRNNNEKASSLTSQLLNNIYMKCSKCPFTTATKILYESHLKRHSITSESNFKCFVCPYYVKTESELALHLPLHGVNEGGKFGAQLLQKSTNNKTSIETNEIKTPQTPQMKRYKCADCPYESNSKSQFTYHEQFHKENNAPFKCEVCNYQVSKRHLLHQHMKVHGLHTSQLAAPEQIGDLTISPVVVAPKESQNLKITESDMALKWVSYCGEFQKMYVCQYCPFVNSRKNNMIEHEKLHSNEESDGNINRCTECTFASNNLEACLSHSKVHRDGYAKIFGGVNPLKSDEVQIAELKESIGTPKLDGEFNKKNNNDRTNKNVNKTLYFCSDCPARFLFERELQIHLKFHCVLLPYRCETCSYTARQHSHLVAHYNVHTKEYQQKTKALQETYPVHPDHKQPNTVAVISDAGQKDAAWIVVSDFKNVDEQEANVSKAGEIAKITRKRASCHLCPAKFIKTAALNYHLTLHGGDGLYKCNQCDYAVKTIGNLAKHEAVHGNAEPDYGSGDDSSLKDVPISGTDLYQHKTKAEKRALSENSQIRGSEPRAPQADPQFGLFIHGNPDFIYPTYQKNGRTKEKRYKCHKCPSAFEKRDQYKVHLTLHGAKQRYKCDICDYSVKYYANFTQHLKKHVMNFDAHVARGNSSCGGGGGGNSTGTKLAIKSLPKQINKDSSRMSISDHQAFKLLQRRRSSAGASVAKDVPDEKKLYRCTYCPYTNQRRDALDNHIRRHASVSGISGNFTCPYCDYAAPQSQFLRDHVKVHFQLPKHINPEYFTNFEGLNVLIRRLSENLETKETLFNLKDLPDVLNVPEESSKVYVLPSSGERVS